MSKEISQDIITQTVAEVTERCGRVDLTELEAMLSLTRQQLRGLKDNGFILTHNGNSGEEAETRISPYAEFIDNEFLQKGGHQQFGDPEGDLRLALHVCL